MFVRSKWIYLRARHSSQAGRHHFPRGPVYLIDRSLSEAPLGWNTWAPVDVTHSGNATPVYRRETARQDTPGPHIRHSLDFTLRSKDQFYFELVQRQFKPRWILMGIVEPLDPRVQHR